MALPASGPDAPFYAPGSWDRDQLAGFAEDLCPGRPIDLGIVRAVKTLVDSGVETFESCQGGEGHAFPEPTVRFGAGRPEEGWKGLSVCLTYGFPVRALRLYWTIEQGHQPTGPHWEIVFRRPLA